MLHPGLKSRKNSVIYGNRTIILSELLRTKFSIFALFLELLGAQNKKEKESWKKEHIRRSITITTIILVYSTIVAVYGEM